MGAWSQFLSRPSKAGHAVQLYAEPAELAESVASYLERGFAAGAPGIVVATATHRHLFFSALAARGVDVGAVESSGLLTCADAHETLATFLDGDTPSRTRFERVVGGLIDDVAARHPGHRVRVFGEMVDVLAADGRADAALALEELWNELAASRDFALLCGYRLDIFDRDAQLAPLPGVCRTHSHVLPAYDVPRLAKAVDDALEEVLGAEGAGRVDVAVATQRDGKFLPEPQLALMWVSAHLPHVDDRVLAAAREAYRRLPAHA